MKRSHRTETETPDRKPVSDTAWLDEAEWAEWLVKDALREREDFPGLVRYHEDRARRHPNDPRVHYALVQAYLQNGEAQKALNFLVPLYRAAPEERAYQEAILDVLFASGRTEKDFDWVSGCMYVYRLTPVFVDACYAYLRTRPSAPAIITELWDKVTAGGYPAFSDEQLLAALWRDARFQIGHPRKFPAVSMIWVEE